MTSNPYAARRFKLAREFHASEDFRAWRRVIEHWAPPAPKAPTVQGQAMGSAPGAPKAPAEPMERLTCIACKTGMRVPKAKLEGGEPINIRCPNPDCGKVLKITPKKPKAPKPDQVGE